VLRYFRRVEARALELGNHRRKYLFGIERWGRLLIDRLEASGSFDRVHLRRRATDVAYEMDCVLGASQGRGEKVNLLGCYFALQFLLINIRSIDMLRLAVQETEGRHPVYRDFLRRIGDDFNRLIREYVRRLMKIFLAREARPEFVICTVGTRGHQDDVDLGIIDDGSANRPALDRALGRMATEMLRWSSAPDFYLSEHVGGAGYSVSVDEYERRLFEKNLDFVSVTEILSAVPLVGSRRLFDEFRDRIHNRYYYDRDGENREHEGYLRGLVGEIDSLLGWPQTPNRVNPKQDLLRCVQGILWAYRAIRRLPEPETFRVITRLGRELRKHRDELVQLEQSYTFVETFRHLYQQFAAQEEEIDVADPDEVANLGQVAEAMGYHDSGVIRGWQHLLVHYNEHVARGREAVAALIPDVARHIRRVSVFTGIIRRRPPARRGGNLARSILDRHRYFRGIKYWNDLLEPLEAERSALLVALVRDLQRLEGDEREEVIERFVDWGSDTYFTALRLLCAIGRRREELAAEELFAETNAAFLARIKGTHDDIRRFATVFVHNAALVHEWLSLMSPAAREHFLGLMSGEVWGEELREWQRQLVALGHLHVQASRYFKHAIDRLCRERTDCLRHMGDLGTLDTIAKGLLAEAMRAPSPAAQKQAVGAFYDVEFLRTGIATLHGVRAAEIDAYFSGIADQYLETLFDICKWEVDRERGRRILTHDLLGLFVSGGHARERAYQDDWDLIVLVSSESEEIFSYANRIVTRLNREIIRRGIMPQHHFADRFGAYVTRIGELEQLLAEGGDDAFVEMSQLLGARMIVGSSRLEELFHARIIERWIFSRAADYWRMGHEELASRHAYRTRRDGEAHEVDIKESPGGLRDIEMAALMWKVRDRVREPIGARFWSSASERHPEHEEAFADLRAANEFLNRLRDVYRLAVAPVNRIDPRELADPAEVMGYQPRDGVSAAKVLARELASHRDRVRRRLDELLSPALAPA
jgi:hypothetical protein